MLESALHYASWGWSVIPLQTKRKEPLAPWKKNQHQRYTAGALQQWWSQHPAANIGVVTGVISGVVVLDIDEPGGTDSLTKHGVVLPLTPTSKSGSGGHHYFFKHPGHPVPNAVGLLPGVDLRGDGGMAVVPPSVHPNGQTYEWVHHPDDTPLADLPMWLTPTESTPKTALTPQDWEVCVTKGARDAELTKRAGKLLGPAQMPPAEALLVLKVWNQTHCQPPLPDKQIEKIVNSIANKEAEKTKHTNDPPGQPPTSSRPSAPPFVLTDYRDFMKEYADNETRWLIEEWLPVGGIGKIVGPPESYKTWVLLDLAVSVASGTPFLGQYRVARPGPVLFFQQEDGHQNLGKRLNLVTCNKVLIPEPSWGKSPDENWVCVPPVIPIQIRTEGALEFDNLASIHYLRELVMQIKPALVILDPLYSATSTKDYMMDTARTMLALKDIREEFGTGFVIGHHARKGGKEGDREEGWGSQFLNAFDEFQWQVRVKKDGRVMVKRRGKVSSPLPALSLLFDIKTQPAEWHYSVSVALDNTADSDTEERILHGRVQQLKKQGRTYKQIEQELGISSKTIGRILKGGENGNGHEDDA